MRKAMIFEALFELISIEIKWKKNREFMGFLNWFQLSVACIVREINQFSAFSELGLSEDFDLKNNALWAFW